MKLSQCMIVKNEEKNIRKALTWGKDICFEQIVVDTGSTDRTVEIAKEMGAKVYYFEWINDFAAAKNYAIEQATGDWIAFLDADEYFDDETARRIEWIITKAEKNKKGLDVIISNLTNLDADGNGVLTNKQIRIFKNRPYIRYTGRIHEAVSDLRNQGLINVDVAEELTVYHTGYALELEEKHKKGDRNLELLFKEYEDYPDCAEVELYLAESLVMAGRQEEAFEFVCKAVMNKDGSLDHDRLLMAHQMRLYEAYERKTTTIEEMIDMYREAVAFDAGCPDFDIAVGYLYYRENCWHKAIEYLQSAINKTENLKDMTYSRVLEQWKTICGTLTMCCLNIEDWNGVVRYGTVYLQEEKTNEGLLGVILNRLLNVELTPAEAVAGYLQGIYNFSDVRDMLFLIKCCRANGFVMLEDALKGYLADDVRRKIYKE